MRFLIVIFLLFSNVLTAQEICDNAIDDDLDGLIDLNDDECNCLDELWNDFDFLDNWVQPSFPTPDFWHEGYFMPDFNVLTGAADGDGFAGLIVDYNSLANGGGTYLEYIGTCLLSPMEQNTNYTIDFSIGFDSGSAGIFSVSDSIDLTFYASTSCDELPFVSGIAFDTLGCPTDYNPTYTELGSIFLTGSFEWIDTSFSFTADQDYEVLVIGGNCVNNYINDNTSYNYVFLDNINLQNSAAQSSDAISEIESEYVGCNSYILNYDNIGNYSVQWYKNGIAIVGETANNLQVNQDFGAEYAALISDGSACIQTNTLSLDSFDVPILTIDQGDYLLLDQGFVQGLNLSSNVNNYAVNWLVDDGLSCNGCSNPSFTATEDITYIVEIIDNISLCKAEASIEIEVEEMEDEEEDETTIEDEENERHPEPKPCSFYVPNVFTLALVNVFFTKSQATQTMKL